LTVEAVEKPNVLILVRDHFSKATDSDGLLVWEDCKGYGFEDAERAIVEHRREKGSQAYRPDPRRIKSLAASYHHDRQRTRWNKERTIDLLRREQPSAEYLHGLPDMEAIEMHFTHAWGMVEAATESASIGQNAARSFILLGAREAFTQIGLTDAEADRRARECVDLKPGEKIPRKPLFKEMEQPDTSWEARQKLAAAPEPEAA
jgi:hypothetical protein